jgi:hypothetical protein
MKFPLHVEADQSSHGEQLCIVDAEGTIICRSPSAEGGYGSVEQIQDQYNLAWLVERANEAAKEGIS